MATTTTRRTMRTVPEGFHTLTVWFSEDERDGRSAEATCDACEWFASGELQEDEDHDDIVADAIRCHRMRTVETCRACGVRVERYADGRHGHVSAVSSPHPVVI